MELGLVWLHFGHMELGAWGLGWCALSLILDIGFGVDLGLVVKR